jgi:hypothetical protein
VKKEECYLVVQVGIEAVLAWLRADATTPGALLALRGSLSGMPIGRAALADLVSWERFEIAIIGTSWSLNRRTGRNAKGMGKVAHPFCL